MHAEHPGHYYALTPAGLFASEVPESCILDRDVQGCCDLPALDGC